MLKVFKSPLLLMDDSKSNSYTQNPGRYWKMTNNFLFFRKKTPNK